MRERLARYAVPGMAVGLGVLTLLVLLLWLNRGGEGDRIDALETRIDELTETAEALVAQNLGFQLQIGSLAVPLQDGLRQAREELAALETATFTFNVAVDEELPIETDVRFARTLEVPIKTTFPINQEFETRIEISGPFGIDLPVNVTVPIDIEIPVDLLLPFTIDETIPVSTRVPIKLDVPVTLDISQTDLAGLATRLSEMLAEVEAAIADLLGG